MRTQPLLPCLPHAPSDTPSTRCPSPTAGRRVSLGALAVQAVVNMRGPDGIVGVIPGEEKHSARLLGLCRDCHERGEVLACTLPSADMVLVPRLPDTAAQVRAAGAGARRRGPAPEPAGRPTCAGAGGTPDMTAQWRCAFHLC